MKANVVTLNVEAGNLPTWAEAQATRLSGLHSFKSKMNIAGRAAARRTLKATLAGAGFNDRQAGQIADGVIDLADLKAAAARN